MAHRRTDLCCAAKTSALKAIALQYSTLISLPFAIIGNSIKSVNNDFGWVSVALDNN